MDQLLASIRGHRHKAKHHARHHAKDLEQPKLSSKQHMMLEFVQAVEKRERRKAGAG